MGLRVLPIQFVTGVENGADGFALEGEMVTRHFGGDYTIAEVEAVLADMRAVQRNYDARADGAK